MLRAFLIAVISIIIVACNSGSNVAGEKTDSALPSNDLGKTLFVDKCSGCHMVNKELTGPALAGVRQRWQNDALLYAFIRNSDSVIQVNAYAKKLWLDYNQTHMLPHKDLSDKQLKSLLDYIDLATVK